MESTVNKGVAYEFGHFVLDPASKTLYIDGERHHLPAKEFETLLLLVENNGRALSKDELMTAIWGDTFVEEVNLAKQISKLRKIVKANGIEYIETIPKHGYRFMANVRRVASEPEVVAATTDESTVTAPTEASRGKWIAAAVGAVLVSLILVLLFAGFWRAGNDAVGGSATIRSIAVLPFRSVGEYEGSEMLRHGLTDALTTKLSSLERLVVRPTNAVRELDGQNAVDSGRKLRVDAILDGSVQRIDNRIRVSVQLIRSDDGRLLWGETFEENSADVFRVQDVIAEQVARSIEPGLTGDDQRRLTKRYTTNPDAHYAYVRGRYFWNKRTVRDLQTALTFFQQAIGHDSNYALAYAGLADTYSLMADYRAAPTLQSYENSRTAAAKALDIDPNLAEAHTALAYVSMYGSWDFRAAEQGYARAVELNPNYATAHQWFSEYLASQGRTDEALAEIRRAKEIDPLSPVINAGEVWVLYYARRYDEAIDLGRKLAELNPEFAEVHEYLKRCYDQKGMYRDAIAARQMRRKLVGLDNAETPALRTAAAGSDRTSYWQARLEQELAEMKTEEPSRFDLAEIYAQLGDKDKAFGWLERSAADRTYNMIYLKVAPNLDPLRSDPRFADLLVRTGL